MNKRDVEKVAGPKGHLIKALQKLRTGKDKLVKEIGKLEEEVSKEVMAAGAVIATEFQRGAKAPAKPRKKGASKKKTSPILASVEAEIAKTPAKKGDEYPFTGLGYMQ